MAKTEIIRLRIDPELKQRAQQFCAANAVPLGQWIRYLMETSLDGEARVLTPAPRRRRPSGPRRVKLSDGTNISRR